MGDPLLRVGWNGCSIVAAKKSQRTSKKSSKRGGGRDLIVESTVETVGYVDIGPLTRLLNRKGG